MAHGALSPLITPPPLPPRQNRQLLVSLSAVAALAAVGLVIWKMGGQPTLPPAEERERPPSEQSVTELPGRPSEELRLPTSYVRLPVEKPPPAQTGSPSVGPPPGPPPGAATAPPPGTPPGPPKPPKGLTPPAQGPHQTQATVVQQVKTVTTTDPSARGAPRWFSAIVAPQGDQLAPPLPVDPAEEAAKTAKSTLFPPAVWETPKDKYKVLYADQLVHGLLQTNINSDIPGAMRIMTTEDVMDRWGHGHVIVPRYTSLLGRQDGGTIYGQQVLGAQITMGIFPDGTAVAWAQGPGQAGDALGANGIPMDVNNHYAKLLVGVGLSAMLNIGVRAPFGSPSGFQPNLGQEFAQEATNGVNQQGQQLLRQFNVRPTLTQHEGFPVTVSFPQNVSFQTVPIIASK